MNSTAGIALALTLAALTGGCGKKDAARTTDAGDGPTATVKAVVQVPAQAQPRDGQVKSLASDGTEIHYRVYGAGEPAIVFVHGWSCDSGYWDSQLNEFASRHTVVTLDLAGHGRSSGDERKEWSMANFGADVAAVVEAVGSPRVVLVGHSMGGPVVLEAARRLPGRVMGIVGVDTLREIVAPMPKEQFEPILAKMKVDFAATTADFVDRNFFSERTDPILRQWIVDDMSAAPPAVAIPAVIGLGNMDYASALDELDVSILAVNSAGLPTDEAAIRRIEPRFRLVTIDGVGHFPMLEAPADFNRILGRIVDAWAGLESTGKPLSNASGSG